MEEILDKDALAGAISSAIIKALNEVLPEENVPEFPLGEVPVAVAAKVYGKDVNWVKAGIIAGWLPIGMAIRSGKLVSGEASQINSKYGRISYHISPKKLWEDTGFIWKGERKVDELSGDFKTT